MLSDLWKRRCFKRDRKWQHLLLSATILILHHRKEAAAGMSGLLNTCFFPATFWRFPPVQKTKCGFLF
jgi:hypothetical protein